jgi:hypothetical protein
MGTGGTSAGGGMSSSSVGTGGSAAGSGQYGGGTSSTLGTGGTSAGNGTSSSSLGTGGSAAGSGGGTSSIGNDNSSRQSMNDDNTPSRKHKKTKKDHSNYGNNQD